EEWHRVLDRFFQLMADGIHRFEGAINQFTGDGLMALFGAPIAHEDHARRGCHAALQLKETLRDYARALAARGLEFAVRMGLNSGEVVLGRIGEDLRMDYTAVGHTVGLAARMEQLAAPGTVYLTEHTARLVEGFFTLRDRGTPPMRGVSVPVRVYELEGVGPLRTRLDASRRGRAGSGRSPQGHGSAPGSRPGSGRRAPDHPRAARRARPRGVVARSRRAHSSRPARGVHATRPARRERRRAGRAAGGRRAL